MSVAELSRAALGGSQKQACLTYVIDIEQGGFWCRNGLLYTLNGQCREERWEQLKDDMEVAARSFHMLGSRTNIPGWGSRL